MKQDSELQVLQHQPAGFELEGSWGQSSINSNRTAKAEKLKTEGWNIPANWQLILFSSAYQIQFLQKIKILGSVLQKYLHICPETYTQAIHYSLVIVKNDQQVKYPLPLHVKYTWQGNSMGYFCSY